MRALACHDLYITTCTFLLVFGVVFVYLCKQLRDKLYMVQNKRKALSAQTRELEQLLHTVDELQQPNARSELVRRSQELVQMIEDIRATPISDMHTNVGW